MRINSTLYYVLKDHLGSASVVTDNTVNAAIVSEQRYYPYGETRLTATMLTDKLFTGQRDIGLGIYHYGARFYSPKLGRFLSADTIVPGYANPQAFNRYSYVINNPLRYTDPTGHSCIEEDGDGNIIHVDCDSGAPPPPWNPPDEDNEPEDDGPPAPINYIPFGEYVTAYNGAGGGLYTTGVYGISGLDGDCEFGGCSRISITGGNVPLNYAASYDVILYENLLIVTIHESYLIPGKAPPLFEAETFGKSTLLSRRGLDQTETELGNFLPGNIAHPENAPRRDTTLYFLGKENFPEQLVIRVVFGAAGLGNDRFFYPLPYARP